MVHPMASGDFGLTVHSSGVGARRFSGPNGTSGKAARLCIGYLHDETEGLLIEARSAVAPKNRIPWANRWLRDEAVRTATDAVWISDDDRSLLVRHISSTPYFRSEGEFGPPPESYKEALRPRVSWVTAGGLTCDPFPSKNSPFGVVFHLVRHVLGHVDHATGLIAEMASDHGPVPWGNKEARKEAIKRAGYGANTDEDARLIAHIRSTPYYSGGADAG